MVKKQVSLKVGKEKPVKKVVKKEKSKDFLMVGIGASAGGLEAFKEFFSALQPDCGMAFILVQHLDPTHKSMLTDLLRNYTKMNVMEVSDGTKVQADNVYIIPPNKGMAILNGTLQLLAPQEERGHRRPIDFFLRSLAEDQKERAVGIILSGTGTEGALGLRAIKGEGGLTIVQEPDTAKYYGMPRSAIAMGSADFILPAPKIPGELIKYKSNRRIKSLKEDTHSTNTKNILEKIFILLRNLTGCNFNDYKSSTVIRRIEKRMAIHQFKEMDAYLTYLQKNQEEVQKLFNELLIGVTRFFRDAEAYAKLQEIAVARIIKSKINGDIIRIWVPGCSTGEEAYSLAMVFDEAISKQKKDLRIHIFASDIDETAINFARVGLYPETIKADVIPSRLSKYFRAEGNAYRIKKHIRDQVIFAQQNVFKDPPFSKLDMVSCRNLLIYLNSETQQKIFSIFHYSLNPEGILFLGGSESLGESSDLFNSLDRKYKIFSRKNVKPESKQEIEYKITEPIIHRRSSSIFENGKLVRSDLNLSGITEKMLLSKYAPASVIINRKGDAVYFFGDTGNYLQPSPGEARLNIVDMAREGLKSDLRTAIAKARKSKKMEERNDVAIHTNGSIEIIDLKIQPITQFEPDEGFLLISFEKQIKLSSNKEKRNKDHFDNPSEIHALEQELDSTKEYLRSTIEELEVSNEELKSTNEELQSANEELQSTNEELETSKEELQSVNEEMITVNSELQGKIDELANAYNDMNNLLSSTEIGTIFLDRDLNVRRFTPSTKTIINLIPSDIGRPLKHLNSNLIYKNLEKDAHKVLEKLVPVKMPVQSTDGAWYQLQIVPYRTSENVIDGVVVTFVDITEEKIMFEELNSQKVIHDQLLKDTKTVVFKQDKKLRYTQLINMYPNLKADDVIGKTDAEILKNKEEILRMETIKKRVMRKKLVERQEVTVTFGKKKTHFDLIVRPDIDPQNKLVGILCTAIDITELKKSNKN